MQTNDSNSGSVKTPGVKTRKDPKNSPFNPPDGFWIRCTDCGAVLQHSALKANQSLCTECGFHFRVGARRRIELISDAGSFREYDQNLQPQDVLGFFDTKSYTERLAASHKKTNLHDAFVAGDAKIKGINVQIGAFDFSFMGGSMGMIVGEKVSRVFDRALAKKQPAIVFHSSGGARMQEGLFSLMQMAKTTAALSRPKANGIPYISVLTDPTTGGVAASFAMLGDLNLAEPKALIGFAGPRVIQQTINQTLPDNFQKSEFLLDHGLIDSIVPRNEMRDYLGRVLSFLVG